MSTIESVNVSKNNLILPSWGVTVTTVTNVNFIIDGSRPSVILARKFEPEKGTGTKRDRGLVTQTGMTSTGFGASQENESIRAIVVRETQEESGILVDPSVPRIFGYRSYDHSPSTAQAYFVTVHKEAPSLRQKGWAEVDEELTPPIRVSLSDFFDHSQERRIEYKSMLSHRIPIALAFLSLERLGYTEESPLVKDAFHELKTLIRERLDEYVQIAKERSPYLIITEAFEEI